MRLLLHRYASTCDNDFNSRFSQDATYEDIETIQEITNFNSRFSQDATADCDTFGCNKKFQLTLLTRCDNNKAYLDWSDEDISTHASHKMRLVGHGVSEECYKFQFTLLTRCDSKFSLKSYHLKKKRLTLI